MANDNYTTFLLFINMNSTNRSLYAGLSNDQSASAGFENLTVVQRLTIYITFVVSIIGIVGNACTIIVLNQQTMRQWRSSILLTALAAADLFYLLIIFLTIIDTLTNQLIGFHRSLVLCQISVYITHVCSFLSANFTLSFTLQRFVAVLFPLHAHTVISYRSSVINILLLAFIGCGFYSFSFFLTNNTGGQCREDEHYPALFPLLIVDVCLTFVIPFIFILLFNCAIVYKLRERKTFANNFDSTPKEGSKLHATDGPTEKQRLYQPNMPTAEDSPIQLRTTANILRQDSDSNKLDKTSALRVNCPRLSTARLSYGYVTPIVNGIKQQQAISQRTTKMLVICSSAFLLFNSPYTAVLFYSIISKRVLARALDILRHFYFMSFCLNFFLYSLCGNRFRHELLRLLKKFCRRYCTDIVCHHCLQIHKLPPQTSVSNTTGRTGL